jgi:AbrB family looped-hinge helix DNA binding protein
MPTTKVTRGYKIAVPAEIREDTNIKIGDKLTLEYDPENSILKIHIPRKNGTTLKLGRDIKPKKINESIIEVYKGCQL